MKLSMYVAISLDGFIAKTDGNIDWLAEDVSFEDTLNDEDYKAFYDSTDALVMGGKTYRQLLTFGDWPYPGKKTIVVSRTEKRSDLSDVFFSDASAEQIAERLELEGHQHVWILGGGEIHSMFLNAGLIDEMRIFVMPKILGEGIPLFAPPVSDGKWKLLETKHWRKNIVELHYAK